MSHFAKVLDEKVVQVIVAEPEFFETFVDTSAGTWIQTSYNTYGNAHKLGGTPLRGNFAGIGYTYDHKNDVFYAPPPFPSWVLNTTTWLWEAPVSKPNDKSSYIWDEQSTSWIELA
jgi:hypothetical protein